MSDTFFWGLCDPDAPIGTTYRTGAGFDELVEALRDLVAREEETLPGDFVPSGNVQLYWSNREPAVS